jgi:hypothetical protein
MKIPYSYKKWYTYLPKGIEGLLFGSNPWSAGFLCGKYLCVEMFIPTDTRPFCVAAVL